MPQLRIGEITHMWRTSYIILSWVSFFVYYFNFKIIYSAEIVFRIVWVTIFITVLYNTIRNQKMYYNKGGSTFDYTLN